MSVLNLPAGTSVPQVIQSIEVFHKDHLWQNRYARLTNQLLRYNADLQVAGHPLIEVWSGSAWTTIGNLQLSAFDGNVTYTPLPLRWLDFDLISPEEITWHEFRYDAGSVAISRVNGRIRRGSRLIELQVIAVSGQGLNGVNSLQITGTGGTTLTTSADGTGVVVTGGASVPGCCYLSAPPFAATLSSGTLSTGLGTPAGTISRIGILAGYQDSQFASAAAYAAKMASYNRQRILQRLMVT